MNTTTITTIATIKQRMVRQDQLIKLAEDSFQGKVKLYNRAVGTEFHKHAFNLKESSRNYWWKEIDTKISLELELNKEIQKLIKNLQENKDDFT